MSSFQPLPDPRDRRDIRSDSPAPHQPIVPQPAADSGVHGFLKLSENEMPAAARVTASLYYPHIDRAVVVLKSLLGDSKSVNLHLERSSAKELMAALSEIGQVEARLSRDWALRPKILVTADIKGFGDLAVFMGSASFVFEDGGLKYARLEGGKWSQIPDFLIDMLGNDVDSAAWNSVLGKLNKVMEGSLVKITEARSPFGNDL